ncbi:tetratricopeptide repeat protein [Spirochaetia bacterium 38H-sp]|uniref:Tetratricopeptide repeat protein n=1 Tax=Rarispira pelagica TaxID=3141764 RepID=A0ABU9UCW6_9SPIR
MRKSIAILLFFMIGFSAFSQEGQDALKLYREGKYSEAISICLKEIKETPRRVDSYVVLGWALLAVDRYKEALDYTKTALEFSPYDYRLLMNAGENSYYLGLYKEALEYFKKYIVIQPSGRHIPEIYAYMGDIYYRWGEYYHADIAYTTALYYKPASSYWWLRAGLAREKSKQLNEALAAYKKVLELSPGNSDARNGVDRVTAELNNR